MSAPAVSAKPKAAPTHPPFNKMIMEAIQTKKDRKGTSLPAIRNFIKVTYPTVNQTFLNANVRKVTKRMVESKELLQVVDLEKSKSQRYKINPEAVKAKAKAAVKPKPKAKPAKKKTPAKKPAAGKAKTVSKTKKSPAKKAAAKGKAKTKKTTAVKDKSKPKKTTKKATPVKKAAKKVTKSPAKKKTTKPKSPKKTKA